MVKIHFLNVGHGDCCIVEFPSSRLTVVDINRTSEMDEESENEILDQLNASSSKGLVKYGLMPSAEALLKAEYKVELTDPITYLENLNLTSIFRFISTHPHLDHLTGLAALKQQFSLANFWVIKNGFEPDIKELTDSQKEDWNLYKKFRDASETKVDDITIVRPEESCSGDFWEQDRIQILAPNDDLIKQAKTNDEPNHLSYVLLIKYGECKIVLGGDAEEPTWKYLAENYQDALSNITILKASHHGRDSGHYQPAVKLMSPKYTVVSVGKKPETDASNKYRTCSDNVVSTRWKGTMVFECFEDGKVAFCPEYDI